MPRLLVLVALTLGALGASVLPATAEGAIYKGKRHGYSLTLNSAKQEGALRLPAVGQQPDFYVVRCARRARGRHKLVLGVAPITPGRRLTAPLNHWRASARFCIVAKNRRPVARFTVRR